jgi:hypothetical protein
MQEAEIGSIQGAAEGGAGAEAAGGAGNVAKTSLAPPGNVQVCMEVMQCPAAQVAPGSQCCCHSTVTLNTFCPAGWPCSRWRHGLPVIHSAPVGTGKVHVSVPSCAAMLAGLFAEHSLPANSAAASRR